VLLLLLVVVVVVVLERGTLPVLSQV